MGSGDEVKLDDKVVDGILARLTNPNELTLRVSLEVSVEATSELSVWLIALLREDNIKLWKETADSELVSEVKPNEDSAVDSDVYSKVSSDVDSELNSELDSKVECVVI